MILKLSPELSTPADQMVMKCSGKKHRKDDFEAWVMISTVSFHVAAFKRSLLRLSRQTLRSLNTGDCRLMCIAFLAQHRCRRIEELT